MSVAVADLTTMVSVIKQYQGTMPLGRHHLVGQVVPRRPGEGTDLPAGIAAAKQPKSTSRLTASSPSARPQFRFHCHCRVRPSYSRSAALFWPWQSLLGRLCEFVLFSQTRILSAAEITCRPNIALNYPSALLSGWVKQLHPAAFSSDDLQFGSGSEEPDRGERDGGFAVNSRGKHHSSGFRLGLFHAAHCRQLLLRQIKQIILGRRARMVI
jgi:hypothetical protein